MLIKLNTSECNIYSVNTILTIFATFRGITICSFIKNHISAIKSNINQYE